VGILGNEVADFEANETAKENTELLIKVPQSDLDTLIIDQYKESIEKDFASSKVNQFLNKSVTPWFNMVTHSRRFIVTLNRLMTGHTLAPASLARFHLNDSHIALIAQMDSRWGQLIISSLNVLLLLAIVYLSFQNCANPVFRFPVALIRSWPKRMKLLMSLLLPSYSETQF